MSSPGGSLPGVVDLFFGVSSVAVFTTWIIYQIRKCMNSRMCAKMRQILPVVLEEPNQDGIPNAIIQVDAEVASNSGEVNAIHVEADKDNIITAPTFVSNVVECIESTDTQPVSFAVQIN